SQFGPRRALAVRTDVTSEDAIAELTRRTVLAYGGIDILVASAGLATSASLTETTLDEWELNFAVLARGYFLAARESFRVMAQQAAGGSIVFVASKNALVAGSNAAAYSSAKAASLHLARCLAEEGGPHGIRVNTDRKSTRLNSSHVSISYAVFCLKKKKISNQYAVLSAFHDLVKLSCRHRVRHQVLSCEPATSRMRSYTVRSAGSNAPVEA